MTSDCAVSATVSGDFLHLASAQNRVAGKVEVKPVSADRQIGLRQPDGVSERPLIAKGGVAPYGGESRARPAAFGVEVCRWCELLNVWETLRYADP